MGQQGTRAFRRARKPVLAFTTAYAKQLTPTLVHSLSPPRCWHFCSLGFLVLNVDRFVYLSKTCPPPANPLSHSNQYNLSLRNQNSVRWLELDVSLLLAGLVEDKVENNIHGLRKSLLPRRSSRETRCRKQTTQLHEDIETQRTNVIHSHLYSHLLHTSRLSFESAQFLARSSSDHNLLGY